VLSPTIDNPLAVPAALPFGAVAFDRLRTEHFLPALELEIDAAKARLAELKAAPGPATFASTIVALERATARVYDVYIVYNNLRAANGDPAMHALAKAILPKLSALESDINLDDALFQRVKAAHATPGQTLTPEQRMLADKTFRHFRRNGGLLDQAGKERLRAIDAELSTLGPQFSENVLKATNAFELALTDRAELAGLPDSAVEAAAQLARERGKTGWIFTLQAPSQLPFLRFAERRDLRERVWRAANTRAVDGAFGNQGLVKQIAALRHERAKLLGYLSHADFQLEERMAERPAAVHAFLVRLLEKSRPAARREIDELRAFVKAEGGDPELQPWDYHYWSNRLKERRFRVGTEELRPYFRLEHVLAGAFEHARRLYDLEFRELAGVPVYVEDVKVYEVTAARTREHMGLLYTDFHPRPTKAGGAWCTRFRGQWLEDGRSQRPHVSIVCNFTRPTGGADPKPSLLTFQEASTLFHEFGHALHSLLSRCAYRTLSCTSVYRDFVELPSQIMENWLKEDEGLAVFARHYATGARVPSELVARLVASENFHAAYMTMRQLRFALVDMAWHSADPAAARDVLAFEAAAAAPTDLLPNIPGASISCSFEHIFSGGYSAGYYGYKWAEVLDADAFELFKEHGIFNRDVADRFRRAILERGGTEHPMRLYQEFRGRAPDPDALLRRSNLI
jgi:peptidyl-dipeptidase Dcp